MYSSNIGRNGSCYHSITAKNPNDPPTIDIVVKQQDDSTYGDITTASEGDVMDYRIVAKLPTIKSKASYLTRFDFADKMDAGLTYNQDSVSISFYGNEMQQNRGPEAQLRPGPMGAAISKQLSSVMKTLWLYR